MVGTQAPIGWLRVFEVAARTLSFSAAARELNVTPSAVSQQVRLLEHRLGQALFQRLPRGLRLTGAGEALMPICRESFQRVDDAVAELFGDRGGGRLVVRVAAGFARHWLLPRLAGFTQAYPDIPLRVVASIWAGEPLDPNVQLDLQLASGPIREMQCVRLTEDALFPVCSPRLLRGRKPPRLGEQALLHTIGFAQGWTDWLKAAGIERAPERRDIEFDSVLFSLEMAATGHGVALARTSFVTDMLKSRRLVAPFRFSLKAIDNVYLMHAPSLARNSPAALFRDWLLHESRLRPA
jgi:LysR family glycine cleavage system transcriptional activator